MSEMRYLNLGRVAYRPALQLQRRLVRRLQTDGPHEAFLLMAEHAPPVITLGRRGRPEHVLAPPRVLAARGIEVHRVRRGGDATWHGPGQLVGYPIMSLQHPRRSLHRYVHDLEEALIRLLARFGVPARRSDGRTGVWAGAAKVAAIGVAVDRWVCYHGFALNVCPDLAGFDLIVPCGLRGCRVTSLASLSGRPVEPAEVEGPLLKCLGQVLGVRIFPAELAEHEHQSPDAEAPQAAAMAEEAPAGLR